MKISSVHVTNFRSLKDAKIVCDNLTALVGPNGAGKSCFLNALDLFYSPSPIVTLDDFYNRQSSEDIEIAVTFKNLSTIENKRFYTRVHEGELPVVRVLSLNPKTNGRYFGFAYRNADFSEVRALSGREQINKYAELRNREPYESSLPPARSQAAVAEALEQWEADSKNADKLELARDDGQFIGFQNVARGYLNDLTRFIMIPAVRDAGDDARDTRGSAITQLMDLVVRAALATNKEIENLRSEIETRYQELTDPARLPELGSLETSLGDTLHTYYQDTDVALNWLPTEGVNLPPPKADVRLVEDDFHLPVSRVGHGLQRAFILSLLQHLAVVRSTANEGQSDVDRVLSEPSTPELNLILAIEEPELYQHPNRQRHFARVLYELAAGKIPGVASSTQVIYATHSPLFVGIDSFDNVRRCTRTKLDSSAPKVTSVAATTWDEIAELIWKANGEPGQKFTGESIKPRVTALMTPWTNEGFFADVAVLVEGEGDRAAIKGVAKALRGIDLESQGCAIIPCNGKGNLDRAAAIFSQLNIPIYVVWDSDKGVDNTEAQNRTLLRLFNQPEEDWPSFVSERCACFEVKLERSLQGEIGSDLFQGLLTECKTFYGIPKDKHALKNPFVLTEIVTRASAAGHGPDTVLAIVDRILSLRKQKGA
ncbi:AAA family ATPase [Rhizomicrobium electricum]|uniref:ATP-dependent endonuclease n=1 Tax=Rhizomicrobium electricum TaxID=480070 RepID=A0ABP3NYY2_9PROT|nr:ATP-dependent endonuclease [Rhizomicrobium electricum]NIJ47360.1 putative ATP-dependent endonuclease of OLD family [Rhizomicrobium electricum]